MDFITANKRNPSKYDAEERGKYGNWLRHNRKLMNAGEMKEERVTMFKELIALSEQISERTSTSERGLRHMVLPLSRLHDVRGERKALLATANCA